MVIEKKSYGWIPARFVMFGFTGVLGVVMHMTALYLLNRVVGSSFNLSQTGAVLVAMTFNFAINNRITYGDQRLRGAAALMGLLRFYLICRAGALSNIGVANFVFVQGSGWFVSCLTGAFLASVFNFAMSSGYVSSGRGWCPPAPCRSGHSPR